MGKEELLIIVGGVIIILVLIGIFTGKIKNLKTQWFEVGGKDKTESKATVTPNNNGIKSVEIDLAVLFESIRTILKVRMKENHLLSMDDEVYESYKKSNVRDIHILIDDSFQKITGQNHEVIRNDVDLYFNKVFDEVREMAIEYEKSRKENTQFFLDKLKEVHAQELSQKEAELLLEAIKDCLFSIFIKQTDYTHSKARGFVFVMYRNMLENILGCEVRIVGGRNG